MESLTFKALPVKTGSVDCLTYRVDEEDLCLVRAFYNENVKEGFYLKITVEKWYRKRSLRQNALWHKMLRVISSSLFMDIEIIKEGIKELAMNEYGYKGVENPVTHKTTPLPSRKANVKEMAILFDVTFIAAGENNVDLSGFVRDVEEWKKKHEGKDGN